MRLLTSSKSVSTKKKGYDDPHCTNLWLIDTPLSIKLICEYKTIIVCKNNFGIIYLTQTWNASQKNRK